MEMKRVAQEKINCLAAGLFVIGVALMAYFNYAHLWPGVITVLGITIVARQFLLGHIVDIVAAITLFLAIFIVAFWDLNASRIVPILLGVGGIYYIISQIALYRDTTRGE